MLPNSDQINSYLLFFSLQTPIIPFQSPWDQEGAPRTPLLGRAESQPLECGSSTTTTSTGEFLKIQILTRST